MSASPAHKTRRPARAGIKRSFAAVTMPNVPSEPMSNSFRSKPRLSFFSTVMPSKTLPSASTASSPATCARIVPKRRTCVPPALVEMRPPMVADPLPPSVRGKRIPSLSAASCRVCKMTPASHSASIASVSIERMAFIRRSESSTAEPLPSGVAPPTIPLLPPCGTIGTPCWPHSFINSATSAVDVGEARAKALPV